MKPQPPDDLWQKMDALHEELELGGRDDGGFTVLEYAKKYGISRDAARCRLRRIAATGKLIAGWRQSLGGGRVRVYRFP